MSRYAKYRAYITISVYIHSSVGLSLVQRVPSATTWSKCEGSWNSRTQILGVHTHIQYIYIYTPRVVNLVSMCTPPAHIANKFCRQILYDLSYTRAQCLPITPRRQIANATQVKQYKACRVFLTGVSDFTSSVLKLESSTYEHYWRDWRG